MPEQPAYVKDSAFLDRLGRPLVEINGSHYPLEWAREIHAQLRQYLLDRKD